MAQPSEVSVFLDFFGQRPQNKVLDFLLENRIFDYSKREIAEHSKVGITNLSLLWDRLVSHGIVMETRRIGKVSRYALNAESPLVKHLIKLDLELTFVENPGNNPGKAALSVG